MSDGPRVGGWGGSGHLSSGHVNHVVLIIMFCVCVCVCACLHEGFSINSKLFVLPDHKKMIDMSELFHVDC